MLLIPYLLVAIVAYLLGSIPFGYLLVRVFRKEDIRSKGSGNIGATNVVRSGAKGLGALTFLLDTCKGFIAVLAGGWIIARYAGSQVQVENALALAGFCALAGHIWTVWLRFKGGKGVATAFGVFVAFAPWAALACLGIFILVFAASRYVSLASIIGAIALPLLAMLLPPYTMRTVWLTAAIFVIPLIVILKHHQNIARLLHGTEYRFGKPKAAAV